MVFMSNRARLLESLGWPRDSPRTFDEAEPPARIAAVHGAMAEVYAIASSDDVGWVRLVGARLCTSLGVTPVAGDWVVLRDDEVYRVLPRRTSLERPRPGGRGRQVLAANIDIVIAAVPADAELNHKMVERLAVMAWDSGSQPLIALTKCDVCPDVRVAVSETQSLVPGVEVLATSAVTRLGIERLRGVIGAGTTATLLGASGVGKTSLLNILSGLDERVAAVGRDGQGRHTTTTRRMHFVPDGGILIDLPGIRALDLSASNEAVADVFSEISELATRCRFSDCSHDHEPGCAVKRPYAMNEGAGEVIEA